MKIEFDSNSLSKSIESILFIISQFYSVYLKDHELLFFRLKKHKFMWLT